MIKQEEVETMNKNIKIKNILETISSEIDKSNEDAEKIITFTKNKLKIDPIILNDEFKKYGKTINKFEKLKESLSDLSSYNYDDQRLITKIYKNIEVLKKKITVIQTNQTTSTDKDLNISPEQIQNTVFNTPFRLPVKTDDNSFTDSIFSPPSTKRVKKEFI